MSVKPFVYVAGPYTSPDPVTNTRRALDVASQLLDSGLVTPFVPHLSLFWDLIHPHPYEDWLTLDLDVLHRCDAMLRIEGESRGADREVAYADEHEIPVFYVASALLGWVARHPIEAKS